MDFDKDKQYPKDTLGYHWRLSRVAFGEDSEATKWLEKKAKQSKKGMSESVIQEESQVLALLGSLHLKNLLEGGNEATSP